MQWEAGAETEERVPCVLVAERDVLKKALNRQPRLFEFPRSLSITIVYEEPQRLPQSDQLRYLSPQTITTSDLHRAASTTRVQTQIQPREKTNTKPRYGKRSLHKAVVSAPAYRYTPLVELVPGNADIYGVVVNISLPKRTSGRDYCMTVSVTDESCPTRSEAIQINVFYPTLVQMPKIKFVGDIIRFHKVKIQQYQDRIQGISFARATRHLVLRELANGELELKTCSETWTFEASDEVRTRELIKWSRKMLAEDITLPQGCPQAPRPMSELKFAENFIDLVVRILFVDDTAEPIRLTVWDGSGSPSESDRILVQTLQQNGIAVPTKGMLKEVIMASCWSVVRDMGFVEGMRTHWCRFRNLAVGTDEPIPGSAITPGGREVLRFREVTSFVLLPEFALDVQHRLASLGEPTTVHNAAATERSQGEARSAPCNTNSSTARPVDVVTVIPEYIQQNVPMTPLRDVLGSSQAPRKFHCQARVSAIWPTDIEKVCKLKSGSDGVYIYSFALTVKDESGSINIIVYGKDAEYFLHGIPPCNLRINTSSKALLEKRFAALLRMPKAMHWCVKSYSVPLPPTESGNLSGQEKAVRYRLFDTLLKCS